MAVPNGGRLAALIYGVIPPIVIMDLLTKSWASNIYGGVISVAPPWLTLRVVHNRGLLFGLGEQPGETAVPVWVVSLITLALLLLVAFRLDPKKKLRHAGIACMIGGALGNCLDRLMHGYVVDFLQILFFPILNLADLAIITGVVLIFMDLRNHHA